MLVSLHRCRLRVQHLVIQPVTHPMEKTVDHTLLTKRRQLIRTLKCFFTQTSYALWVSSPFRLNIFQTKGERIGFSMAALPEDRLTIAYRRHEAPLILQASHAYEARVSTQSHSPF